MKQTAVEFLEEKIRYYISNDDRLYDMFKQAKAMEKEQIVDAFSEGTKMIDVNDQMSAMLNGFIYYGETYEQSKQG